MQDDDFDILSFLVGENVRQLFLEKQHQNNFHKKHSDMKLFRKYTVHYQEYENGLNKVTNHENLAGTLQKSS